jgi:hypothetical protein
MNRPFSLVRCSPLLVALVFTPAFAAPPGTGSSETCAAERACGLENPSEPGVPAMFPGLPGHCRLNEAMLAEVVRIAQKRPQGRYKSRAQIEAPIRGMAASIAPGTQADYQETLARNAHILNFFTEERSSATTSYYQLNMDLAVALAKLNVDLWQCKVRQARG